MLNLDPNTLLALELFALAVLVVLGIWRLARHRSVASNQGTDQIAYDMRRDGPRLSA